MVVKKFGVNIVILMLIGSSFSFSGNSTKDHAVERSDFDMVILEKNDAFVGDLDGVVK